MQKRYQICWPYRSRSDYHHHDDMDLTDEWQKEVYLHGQHTMRQQGYRSVLDLGCGSGYKLIHELGEFETTGLELECNLARLRTRYPDRNWQLSDLGRPPHQHEHKDTYKNADRTRRHTHCLPHRHEPRHI